MFRLPNVHVSPAKRTCFACQTRMFRLPNVHVLGVKQRVKKFAPNGCLQMVITNVEIWRTQHAVGVLSAIAQIFGDVSVDTSLPADCEDEMNFEMEWEEVRNDPSFLSMMDSQDWIYCDTDTSMESNTPMNNSSFFEEFAMTYKD